MNKQLIEKLSWDTAFFQMKVGKVFVRSVNDLELISNEFSDENYDLCYLFTDEIDLIDKLLCEKYRFALVDRKVVLKCDLMSEELISNIAVFEYILEEVDDKMIELAFEAGKYSRYRKDEKFQPDIFRKLYREWIVQSVKKKIANVIFVAKVDSDIVGLVTLSIKNNIGTIGLISVDAHYQGSGIGTKLLSKVKTYLFDNNIFVLKVATQLDNSQALSFYKKGGFKIESITNIYHLWKYDTI